MNKQTLGIVIAVVIVVLIAAYFTFRGMHSRNAEHMSSSQMTMETGKHPTVQAPDFSLPTLDGETVTLSQFKGKPVVLNFFATWCPACKGEIPGFVNIYNRYKDKGLVMLGISLDTNPRDALPPFIKENGIPYPIVIGNREVMEKYGGIQSIPTTFFVDKTGQITNVHIGYLDENALEEAVKELL